MEKNTTNRLELTRRDFLAAALGAAAGATVAAVGIEGARRVSELSNSKTTGHAIEAFLVEEELTYGRLLAAKSDLKEFLSRVDFGAFGIEGEVAEFIDFATQADWEKMRLPEIRAALDELGMLFTSNKYTDGSWKVGFARSLPLVVDQEEGEWSRMGRFDLKVFGNSDSARKVLGPITGVSLSVDIPAASEGDFYKLPEGSKLIARAEINKGLDLTGEVTETVEIYDAPDQSQARVSAKLATEPARQFAPASYQIFSINKNSNTIGHLESDAMQSDFPLKELLGINPRY